MHRSLPSMQSRRLVFRAKTCLIDFLTGFLEDLVETSFKELFISKFLQCEVVWSTLQQSL